MERPFKETGVCRLGIKQMLIQQDAKAKGKQFATSSRFTSSHFMEFHSNNRIVESTPPVFRLVFELVSRHVGRAPRVGNPETESKEKSHENLRCGVYKVKTRNSLART